MVPLIGQAHPGKLDKNGGHVCRTNCSNWGLKDGEYHYHNSDGTIRRSQSNETHSKISSPKVQPAIVISIYVNGVKQTYDQSPIIDNGRTLVPLRGIFESLGANVKWDSGNQEIYAYKGDTKVQLQIGSKNTKVNGVNKTLDVPAQIKNGRTLVPLRFVGESLGGLVLSMMRLIRGLTL